MESLDYFKIREYCRAGLEIADTEGIHEGLTFVIGEKLSPLITEYQKAQSHIKFLYNEEDTENVGDLLSGENPTLRESYSLALQTTYRRSLKKIEDLQQLCDDFVEEIKEAFDMKDIIEFLESYPRLNPHPENDLHPEDFMSEEDPDSMSVRDLLSEVDDIYMVETLKKYFPKAEDSADSPNSR